MYLTQDDFEDRLNQARQRGANDEQVAQLRVKYQGSVKPKDNLIVGAAKAIAKPAVDFGRDVVGGTYAANAAAAEILGRLTVDPQNKNKRFDREIQRGLSFMTPRGKDAALDQSAIPTKQVELGIQRGAGAGSYLVPGGSTLKAAVGMGAVSGALYGASQGEHIDPMNIAKGGAGGFVGGGAGYGLVKGTGALINAGKGAYNKVGKKATDVVAAKAQQGYNKATPSNYAKAIEEHGLDLNELTRKHVPAGSSYDDLLGTVKERGNGGLFKTKIEAAEAVIDSEIRTAGTNTRIPVDDFVAEIRKQAKELLRVPGNEKNAEALLSLAKDTERLYKNGVTPKRLLEIKRAADSKYGSAVVDEATGSVAAQFQKSLGNYARNKLKSSFPDVADALDLETELYILKPILNKARATANTQGSSIRTGNVTSLKSPLQWADAYLNNPEAASRLLNVDKSFKAMPMTNIDPKIASGAGRGLGFVGGASMSQVENPEEVNQFSNKYNSGNNYKGSENSNGQINHNQNINPQAQQVKPGTVIKPGQAALLASQGVSLNQYWVVSPDGTKIWNPNSQKFIPYEPSVWEDSSRKLTDKQRGYVGAAQIGEEMLGLLGSGNTSTGPIAGRLSNVASKFGIEDPEQTALRSKIATARTVARNALLGANMSDQEINSYLDAMFDINQPTEILRQRLQTFIEDMNTLAATDTEGSIDLGGLQ